MQSLESLECRAPFVLFCARIHLMKPDLSKVLKDALKRPPGARAKVAGSLLGSIEEAVDPNSERPWEVEGAGARPKALDSSPLKTIRWAEVRRKMSGS